MGPVILVNLICQYLNLDSSDLVIIRFPFACSRAKILAQKEKLKDIL